MLTTVMLVLSAIVIGFFVTKLWGDFSEKAIKTLDERVSNDEGMGLLPFVVISVAVLICFLTGIGVISCIYALAKL